MHTQQQRNLPSETKKFASFLLSFLESYPHDGRNVPKGELEDEYKWFYFEQETSDLKDALTGFLTFFIHDPNGSSVLPGMKRLPENFEPRPLESSLSDDEASASLKFSPPNKSSVDSSTDLTRSIVSKDRTPIIAEDAAENISIHPAPTASNLDANSIVTQVTEPQPELPQIIKDEAIDRPTPLKRTSESMHDESGLERFAKRKRIVPSSSFRLPMAGVRTNIIQTLDQSAVEKRSSQKSLPPKRARTSMQKRVRKPVFILPKPRYNPRPWNSTFGELFTNMDY
jgi:hypothetical protein